MIGTVFAPEPLPAIETLRAEIETPLTSHFQRVACRCKIFYQEALIESRIPSIDDANIFRACMEAMLSASQCILECSAVSSDLERSRTLGSVTAYGFVQALTQIVESIAALEIILDLEQIAIR